MAMVKKINIEKPMPRVGHIAAAFGKYMVIWGGYSDQSSSDHYMRQDEIWVFDSEIKKWHLKRTTGEAPHGTSGACGVIAEQFLYIMFGHNDLGNTSDVYRIGFHDYKWEQVSFTSATSPAPRDKLTAWIYGNKIFTFGGYGVPLNGFLNDHGDYFLDSTTVPTGYCRGWNNQTTTFDPRTSLWSNPACSGNIPPPRAAHATALLMDHAYLFGGRFNEDRLNDLYSLHLPSLVWTKLHCQYEVPVGRSWHSFNSVYDTGTLLMLFGGYSHTGEPLGDTWLLNLADMTWNNITPSHCDCPHSTESDASVRLWHTAVNGSDGDVLIFGGCRGDILDWSIPDVHTNDVCIFRCWPRSLRNITLDAVYSYKGLLESEWSSLPRSLSNKLYIRDAETYTDQLSTNTHNENTTTCSIV